MITKIYTLSSTRDINNIRYVGKTKQELKRRLSGHLCSAKKFLKESNHLYRWIRKELKEGYTIKIEELDRIESNNDEDWKIIEKYWISQFKCWNFTLVNIREGGEDNYCPHPTKEAITKRADKIKGVPRPIEIRNKISKGLKGIKRTDEVKNKVRNSIVAIQGKPVIQYDMNGNFIKEWEYGSLAARELNLDKGNLSKCCKRQSSNCGGFIWRFKGDPVEPINRNKYIVVKSYNSINIYSSISEASRKTSVSETSIRKSISEKCPKKNLTFYRYKDYYK